MSPSPDGPLCLVTGVGPGTGTALVERFLADGYRVVMLARDEARLQALADRHARAHPLACNVADAEALGEACGTVLDRWGAPDVLIHNAVRGARGDFLEIAPKTLQGCFDVNVMALLNLAQALAPAMIERGSGAILATGNTAAYRGKDFFAGFAPTKAAQRILLESMARSAGPKGIHVAYVAIDAVIDLEWTRAHWPDEPDAFFCKPADIAEECFRLAHQPRSAWSFESVIRPFGEPW